MLFVSFAQCTPQLHISGLNFTFENEAFKNFDYAMHKSLVVHFLSIPFQLPYLRDVQILNNAKITKNGIQTSLHHTFMAGL